MEWIEGNKLIAKFMGIKNVFEYDFGDDIKALYIASKEDGDIDYKNGIDWLDYTDWNKLMPVIDKIEELDMSKYHYKWIDLDNEERCNFVNYEVNIDHRACSIWMNLQLDPVVLVAGDYRKEYDTRIKAVWECVVEFIQYYNKITNE